MRRRHYRWFMESPPPSRHFARDTLLVYGGFAAVVVVIGVALGRPFVKTVLIAAVVYVIAVVWAFYVRRRAPKR